MATFFSILGILAAVLPALLEIWKGSHARKAKATYAIGKRDRDELRAILERRDRMRAVHKGDKPVPKG